MCRCSALSRRRRPMTGARRSPQRWCTPRQTAASKVLEMPVERTQEAQIEALRALIIYQVDAIVFTPLVESGWDNVLREAKSASVPLIAVDRSVRGVEGVPLYHIGFDYAGLAERAAAVLSASERAIQRGDQPCKGVYS